MAKIDVSNLPGKLSGVLERTFPASFARGEGIKVEARQADVKGYQVDARTADALSLSYGSTSDLLCALGDLLCDDLAEKSSVPRFEFRGVSLDCSRNGSPTIEFLQDALVRLALMGLTHFCLYTEDTYEVEGEPLIGFARGRYSKDELRRLVAFSKCLGVELFPCLQTLGHLEHIFKYGFRYSPLSENPRVINTRAPGAYEFLEKLIDNAREPYDSKLIHLGTDEPWGIGRGKSLDFDKPEKPSELYVKHLQEIAGLCEKRGLKGMVWGDYVLGHSGEKALDAKEAQAMPHSLVMDYWSYKPQPDGTHEASIDAYKNYGYEVVVSPGLWNWGRFWGNSSFAQESMAPLLESAAQKGVKKALLTMWGDDGQESLFDSNWLSLAFFLGSCRQAAPSEQFCAKRVETIAQVSVERLQVISAMENPRFNSDKSLCVGKPLLYDDPLLSIVNKLFKDDEPFKHFSAMAERLRGIKPLGRRDARLKRLATAYAHLIALKFRMQRQTRLACLSGNRNGMKKSLRLVPDVRKALRKFRDLYSEAWLAERKSFGLELVELRLGGLEARLDSFTREVRKLASGEIKELAEFSLANPEGLELKSLQTYCSVSSKGYNAIWV